jgi:hypothetical protein
MATIDVEKTETIKHVQVVGDVYVYGQNYIYEPVYTSVFLNTTVPIIQLGTGVLSVLLLFGIHSQFSDIETTSIYA